VPVAAVLPERQSSGNRAANCRFLAVCAIYVMLKQRQYTLEPHRMSELPKMPRGPCTFRQTDLKRAVKGARAGGIEIVRVEITKDGKIIIVPGKSKEAVDDRSENEWDSVA
jgi:hypothetical protein